MGLSTASDAAARHCTGCGAPLPVGAAFTCPYCGLPTPAGAVVEGALLEPQPLPVTPAIRAALAAEGMPAQSPECTRASGPLKVLMGEDDLGAGRRGPVCRAYWPHGALTLSPRQAEELLGLDEPLVAMDFDAGAGLISRSGTPSAGCSTGSAAMATRWASRPQAGSGFPIEQRMAAASPTVDLPLLPGMLDVIRAESLRSRSQLALIGGTVGMLIGLSALVLSLIGATGPRTGMAGGGPDLAGAAGIYGAVGVAVLLASVYAIVRRVVPWSPARDPTARRGTFSRGRGPVRVAAARAGEGQGTRPLWLDGRAVCSVAGDLRLSMHLRHHRLQSAQRHRLRGPRHP